MGAWTQLCRREPAEASMVAGVECGDHGGILGIWDS